MLFVYCALAMWLTWWTLWLLVGIASERNIRREPFTDRLWHLIPLTAGMGLVFSPVAVPIYFPMGWPSAPRWLALAGLGASLDFTLYARLHLGSNWSGLVAIKAHHRLVHTGPYRYVRHPIYTGLIAAVFLTAISVNSLAALLGAVLCSVAFVIKLKHEERFLAGVFGSDYAWLCATVPNRLVPGIY